MFVSAICLADTFNDGPQLYYERSHNLKKNMNVLFYHF